MSQFTRDVVIPGPHKLILGGAQGDPNDVVLSNSSGELALRGAKLPSVIEIAVSLPGALPATATNFEAFFIANRAYEVVSARESHRTAGTDAGAVTLDIEKLVSGEALNAGVSVLAGTFNLKGTANTPQSQGATTTVANRQLAAGDRLALKDAGVLTALAGLVVTVQLKPI